jgi:hypothetical protein
VTSPNVLLSRHEMLTDSLEAQDSPVIGMWGRKLLGYAYTPEQRSLLDCIRFRYVVISELCSGGSLSACGISA